MNREIENNKITTLKILCLINICITYLQIFFGVLLAGLKGGYIYNDFPLMGGEFIPKELMSGAHSISLNCPVFVQFMHRLIAYVLICMCLIFIFNLFLSKKEILTKIGILLCLILFIQAGSGILTLIYIVPVKLALLHQLGAIILLSSFLYCYLKIKNA